VDLAVAASLGQHEVGHHSPRGVVRRTGPGSRRRGWESPARGPLGAQAAAPRVAGGGGWETHCTRVPVTPRCLSAAFSLSTLAARGRQALWAELRRLGELYQETQEGRPGHLLPQSAAHPRAGDSRAGATTAQ
jgi:hypothetical protein